MNDSATAFSFDEVTAFASRLQAASERTVRRLWGDASTWVDRRSRRLVSDVLTEARKFTGDLRHRAERAIRDWEARRTRMLRALEEQVAQPIETVRKRVNVASADEVAKLRDWIARVEERLDALAKQKAQEGHPAHRGAAAASVGT